MCSLQLFLAVDKFGSVHVGSPIPDSKFQTWRPEAMSLEVFCLQQKGKLADRCLVQESLKQCGKILKGSLLITSVTQKISTRKNLKNVTQQSKPRHPTVPEQEERAGHLHHNYKKQ